MLQKAKSLSEIRKDKLVGFTFDAVGNRIRGNGKERRPFSDTLLLCRKQTSDNEEAPYSKTDFETLKLAIPGNRTSR